MQHWSILRNERERFRWSDRCRWNGRILQGHFQNIVQSRFIMRTLTKFQTFDDFLEVPRNFKWQNFILHSTTYCLENYTGSDMNWRFFFLLTISVMINLNETFSNIVEACLIIQQTHTTYCYWFKLKDREKLDVGYQERPTRSLANK